MPTTFDSRLVACSTGPAITAEGIVRAVPEPFPGKEDFVDFYTRHNGAWFMEGAIFYRSRLQPVPTGALDRLEVVFMHFVPRFEADEHDDLVSMLHIRRNLAQRRPALRGFAEAHLPLASDASGNEFWLDLSSGRVSYALLDEFDGTDNLVDVASSFREFVTHLEPRPSTGTRA